MPLLAATDGVVQNCGESEEGGEQGWRQVWQTKLAEVGVGRLGGTTRSWAYGAMVGEGDCAIGRGEHDE